MDGCREYIFNMFKEFNEAKCTHIWLTILETLKKNGLIGCRNHILLDMVKLKMTNANPQLVFGRMHTHDSLHL